jgi:bifunctional DNA-binding transcriptional regulator/antitoxin component of YhaV-PrlF toxin-antitoxin module
MAEAKAFPIRLGKRGRLALPVEIRRRWNVRKGDHLLLNVEADGSVHMISARLAVRETRGLYRARADGRSLVDELIADRRH